jgi:hypothetical protein
MTVNAKNAEDPATGTILQVKYYSAEEFQHCKLANAQSTSSAHHRQIFLSVYVYANCTYHLPGLGRLGLGSFMPS